MKKKIICTGVSKTATVSLTYALGFLGWNINHYPNDRLTEVECLVAGKGPVGAMHAMDGISDLPAALYWRELLEEFPDALIIHTIRDEDAWIESIRKHYIRFKPGCHNPGGRPPYNYDDALRVAMWGCCDFNEEVFRRKYNDHNAKIRWFRVMDSRNLDRVLIMDIPGGAGWKSLVDFLRPHWDKTPDILAGDNEGYPQRGFPYENVTRG